MNVEEFVSESISQIIRGVKKAAGEGDENGARVVPLSGYRESGPLQLINFDLAVTVQKGVEGTAEGKGKVGMLRVLGAEVSAGATGSIEQTSVSRLQFTIPVDLPFTERKRETKEKEAGVSPAGEGRSFRR